MKLTKSKQFLADAINASGKWWPDGANWAAQDKHGPTVGNYRSCAISMYVNKPRKPMARETSWDYGEDIENTVELIRFDKLSPNWHQTILSRDEYFSAYPEEPAADADGWIEWKGGECPVDGLIEVDVKLRSHGSLAARKAKYLRWTHKEGFSYTDIIAYRLHKPGFKPESNAPEPEAKPTIEQLAADFRNARDCAERKQQEADDAKEAADARLALLVDAGKALGLDIAPITEKKEPELVITDWRKLQIGDVIKCIGDAWTDKFEGKEATVIRLERDDYKYEHRIYAEIGSDNDWGCDFEFIRRP